MAKNLTAKCEELLEDIERFQAELDDVNEYLGDARERVYMILDREGRIDDPEAEFEQIRAFLARDGKSD